MAFKPPGPRERLRAIGLTPELPETLQRAFEPGEDFQPLPVPQPSDWLAVHPETGQTFADFVRVRWPRPDKTRNIICLQPLGEFTPGHSPSLERLQEYAAAFFMLPVEVLPPRALDDRAFTPRINPLTRNRQILTTDVLAFLKAKRPTEAFCILGITMVDLYPDPAWNFVFGQASLTERVGVFSFARYDPAFYGRPRGENYQQRLLWRSCKVLVHETAHMFGLQHCIFFRCVLNGSNHLRESDARPLHLCPVCLRKLQYSIGFDVVTRYRRLQRVSQQCGFADEARWLARRLRKLEGSED